MRVLPLALCLLAVGARSSVAQDPSNGTEPPPERVAEPPADGIENARQSKDEPAAPEAALAELTDEQILAALERRAATLKERVGRALVSISVTTEAYPLPRFLLPGLTIGPAEAVAEEVEGTGILLSDTGHIVTSIALVANAAAVTVRFHDGEPVAAAVIGVDPPFGIAVLQATPPQGARTIGVAKSTDSERPRLGWLVGPLDGAGDAIVQQRTVRRFPVPDEGYDRYLSAPGALLPGGAGSALVDRHGQLLGVAVTSRRAPDRAGAAPSSNDGATLFVSADDVERAVREIAEHGRVRRGILGVLLAEESTRIDQVIPGGPAESAGLAEGDRILRIADAAMATAGDVTRALLRKRPGDVVRVELARDSGAFTKTIELRHTAYPPVPKAPPLVGATLQISGSLAADGSVGRSVIFSEVEPDLPLHAAGVRTGDELVSIDGRPTMQFLMRHRIKPQGELPRELIIRRAGRTLTLRLPE